MTRVQSPIRSDSPTSESRPHVLDSARSGGVIIISCPWTLLALSTGLVCNCKEEGHPILTGRDSRDVTLARRIFDELDVPRLHGDRLSSCNLELPSAAKRDYILTTWTAMPIGDATGCRPMDLSASDRLHLGYLATWAACGELELHFFGVSLTVRACIEPSDERRFSCLRDNQITLSVRPRYQNEQAYQTQSDWKSYCRSHCVPPAQIRLIVAASLSCCVEKRSAAGRPCSSPPTIAASSPAARCLGDGG